MLGKLMVFFAADDLAKGNHCQLPSKAATLKQITAIYNYQYPCIGLPRRINKTSLNLMGHWVEGRNRTDFEGAKKKLLHQ